MCASALLHSLIHDHPFHNGNKRTALVSLLVFLDKNDFMLTCDENELFKFVLQIAQHKIIGSELFYLPDKEVSAITKWIVRHSRSIEKGERPLPFRRLRQILNRYDCIFELVPNGKIKITRTRKVKNVFGRKKTMTSFIQAIAEGKEVDRETISGIRQDLGLNEVSSVDSAAFYEDSPITVSEFIAKYRRTLLRLSKL